MTLAPSHLAVYLSVGLNAEVSLKALLLCSVA